MADLFMAGNSNDAMYRRKARWSKETVEIRRGVTARQALYRSPQDAQLSPAVRGTLAGNQGAMR